MPAKGSVRAVCGQMPAECEALDLSQSDIEMLALDRRRLAEAIAEVLGVLPQVRESGAIVEVGSYGIAAGLGIRVLFLIPGPVGLGGTEVLERLRAERVPALVLTPTTRSVPDEFRSRLAAFGHQVLALDGSMVLDPFGRIKDIRSAESILTPLREQVRANLAVMTPGRAWVLPPDARWEELAFEFIADEVLNIRFRGKTRRFEPEHVRMKDQRSGRPTEQWALLKIIASYGGRLGWLDAGAKDMLKKRKQELAKKLRAAFGIEEDPIIWNYRTKVYETRFSIRGDVLDASERRRR